MARLRVFPSPQLSKDPRSGKMQRHHLFEAGIRRSVSQAVKKAEINKHASPHTFRHSFGRPFGRLVNTSMDVTRYLERVFSPWRLGEPSNSRLVSFQGT